MQDHEVAAKQIIRQVQEQISPFFSEQEINDSMNYFTFSKRRVVKGGRERYRKPVGLFTVTS